MAAEDTGPKSDVLGDQYGHKQPATEMKLTKGDVVEITWKDSHAIYGWHELEDLTPSIIVSVGYVLKEEADYVVLVSSNSDSGNHFTALSIPRGCIGDTNILKAASKPQSTAVNNGQESVNGLAEGDGSYEVPGVLGADEAAEVEVALGR